MPSTSADVGLAEEVGGLFGADVVDEAAGVFVTWGGVRGEAMSWSVARRWSALFAVAIHSRRPLSPQLIKGTVLFRQAGQPAHPTRYLGGMLYGPETLAAVVDLDKPRPA